MTETTNITADATAVTESGKEDKKKAAAENKEQKQPKKRGPPENGVPSKTKVMVANLPYELSEDKVRFFFFFLIGPLLMQLLAQGTFRSLLPRVC